MNDTLDEVVPVKTIRVRDKDVPYMTSDWKSAIRAKRKANDEYLKKYNPGKLGIKTKSKERGNQTKTKSIQIILE